jgi:hypothetical protein
MTASAWVPLSEMEIFIQLTAMRKDDGKRLGAAVRNWNFYLTHCHEKRRRLGVAVIKGNFLSNSPP